MSTAKKLGRGKNHSGYTTQLPNGRYRTFLMYKGKTVSAVGSTPKESKSLAVAKRDNLPQAIGKLPKHVLNLKLIDFMPDWLHDKHRKKVAPTTYKRYVGLMENWVIPSLGHVKIVELNKHHVNAFIESMESKVGPRSQQQAKALLSAAFAFLVKKEWINDNPVLKSDEIICEKKEINPATRAPRAKYPQRPVYRRVNQQFQRLSVCACFLGFIRIHTPNQRSLLHTECTKSVTLTTQ